MRILFLTILLATYTAIGFGQNLISNSSFETGAQLNCQSWFDYCGIELEDLCDTITPDTICSGAFNQDSVMSGESWCLVLRAGMAPMEALAETYITGQSDTNIYQLEYWMKSRSWGGKVSIGTVSQNQFTESKSRSDTTSIWKKFTLIDTITTQTTDTIAIRLSAGFGDFCICTSYFDLLELSIVDPATTALDIDRNTRKVIVYPNPASEVITIEIHGNRYETHRITLYTVQGQVITTIETDNSTVTWESGAMASGMYFYQVQNATDNELVQQGKLVIE